MADDDVFLNAIRHAQSIYRDRPGSLPVFATTEPRTESKDLAARMKAQEQPEGPGQSFMDDIRELLDRTQVVPGLSLQDVMRQHGGSMSHSDILDSIRALRVRGRQRVSTRQSKPESFDKSYRRGPGDQAGPYGSREPARSIEDAQQRPWRKATSITAPPKELARQKAQAWQREHPALSRFGNAVTGGVTDPNVDVGSLDLFLAAVPFLANVEHGVAAGARMAHGAGRDMLSRFSQMLPSEAQGTAADWAVRGLYNSGALEEGEPDAPDDAGMGRYLNFLKAMKRGGLVLNDMYTSPEFPSMTGDRPAIDVNIPTRE